MVRTGNIDFSCNRLTSTEIRKSKNHIIRQVCFRWDNTPPPPQKDIWIRAWGTINFGSCLISETNVLLTREIIKCVCGFSLTRETFGSRLSFPKQALVFTCLQYKSFENAVGKGEIARNEQFLLFPQSFLTIRKFPAISIKFEIVFCKLFEF